MQQTQQIITKQTDYFGASTFTDTARKQTTDARWTTEHPPTTARACVMRVSLSLQPQHNTQAAKAKLVLDFAACEEGDTWLYCWFSDSGVLANKLTNLLRSESHWTQMWTPRIKDNPVYRYKIHKYELLKLNISVQCKTRIFEQRKFIKSKLILFFYSSN